MASKKTLAAHSADFFATHPYSDGTGLYIEDPALLKTQTTYAWWYDGEYNATPLNAALAEGLTFANGQYVALVALGEFTMHRPRLVQYSPNTFHGWLIHEHSLEFHSIPLYDQLTMYTVEYTVAVDSKFAGQAFVTQVFNGSFGTAASSVDTHGFDYLDNVEIIPWTLATVTPGNLATIDMHDTPSVRCSGYTFFNEEFTDYVRFQPPGGIAVTLGSVKWHIYESTDLMTIPGTTDQDYTPFPTASEEFGGWYYSPTGNANYDGGLTENITFPYWIHTFHNTD